MQKSSISNKPLVSVIIPNFNYQHYIEEAINSVLHADFDPENLEIVVIDDASTDDSVKLIERIIRNANISIRLIKNVTNLGLIRTRNTGIVNAKGEFLFFLDPDNYIGKDCLKLHAGFLTRRPDYAACYAPVQVFDNETKDNMSLISNEPFNLTKLTSGNYIDAMAMFRKKSIIEAGMYDRRMPPIGWEDYELWLRLAGKGYKVGFIEGPALSFYRYHQSNMCKGFDDNDHNLLKYYLNIKHGLHLRLEVTKELEQYFKPEKKRLVQLFFSTTGNHDSRPSNEEEFTFPNPLTWEFSGGRQRFAFPVPPDVEVKQLRFFPLNDYVYLKINSVRFFNNGSQTDIKYQISANALMTEENLYLFDHTNPQIFIDFNGGAGHSFDEVCIETEYLQTGTKVFAMVQEYYRKTMQRHEKLLFNRQELKRRIKNLFKIK
jgi:glycosyltransferase involved in cell wall biosynthesis